MKPNVKKYGYFYRNALTIVFLTIYLRQKGSLESKPVDALDMETGK